jgi:2,3-bisphosphoglycerate-independent phosphoglycerate mutase
MASSSNPAVNEAIDSALKKAGPSSLRPCQRRRRARLCWSISYAAWNCASAREQKIFLHAFTDGRDTPPNSRFGLPRQIEAKMKEIGVGKVATSTAATGQWTATTAGRAWKKLIGPSRGARGRKFRSAAEAIQDYYDHPTEPNMSGDEFVAPSSSVISDGVTPRATVKDGDSVIFYNYRGDRPREITKAFVASRFQGIRPRQEARRVLLHHDRLRGRASRARRVPKPPKMNNILGEYISDLGLKQFRCAETEKFPHVTFFFNDYRDQPFPGEDRQIIPSPKEVSPPTTRSRR